MGNYVSSPVPTATTVQYASMNTQQEHTPIQNETPSPTKEDSLQYLKSWAFSFLNEQSMAKQRTQFRNDQLMKQIVDATKFPVQFWKFVKDRNDIAITGSFPLRIALGVNPDDKDWKDQDIDIFVSHEFVTQPVQKLATELSKLDIKHDNQSDDLKAKESFDQKAKLVMSQVWELLGLSAQPLLKGVNMVDYQTSFEKQGDRFLQEKRKDASERKVNVVVVDIKGQTMSYYVQNHFDLSVCTITTNGTQMTIPQPELLSLKHSTIRKDTLPQRRVKYAKRGFLFV
jgi:hypothetical protein